MRIQVKAADQPLQRGGERLVLQRELQVIFLLGIGHGAAGKKHAAQKRHPAALAHGDLPGHAAPLRKLDAAALQHEGGVLALKLDAVGVSPAQARAVQRHQLRLHVKDLLQEPEGAPGDRAVLRLDGKPLLAAAAIDDRARRRDDPAQLRKQAADAVRLKAAELLLGLR